MEKLYKGKICLTGTEARSRGVEKIYEEAALLRAHIREGKEDTIYA